MPPPDELAVRRAEHVHRGRSETCTRWWATTGHPDDGATYDPEAELAAAIEPLRGAACLGCGIERSSVDRATGDGVCESCREDPDAVPVVTRRRQITVGRRCAAVARQAGPRPGPGLRQRLRQLYTEADPADRPLIAEWVAYNDNRIPQAPRRRR